MGHWRHFAVRVACGESTFRCIRVNRADRDCGGCVVEESSIREGSGESSGADEPGVRSARAALPQLVESCGKTVPGQRVDVLGLSGLQELLDVVTGDAESVRVVLHLLHRECEEHQHSREEQCGESLHTDQ